jgi:hypothetical protein
MTIHRLWFFGLVFVLGLGCDEPRQQTQDIPPATQPAGPPIDHRPALAEMLRSPRKTLPLASCPLSVQVPSSWQIKTHGPVSVLQGPTPHGPPPDGVIHIMISEQPSETLPAVQAREKRAQDQQKSDPKAFVNVRDIGGARLIEQRSTQPATADGKTPPTIKWNVLVFVPGEKGRYIPCELEFLYLPAEQYEQDKELFDLMISSLQPRAVDSPGGPGK